MDSFLGTPKRLAKLVLSFMKVLGSYSNVAYKTVFISPPNIVLATDVANVFSTEMYTILYNGSRSPRPLYKSRAELHVGNCRVNE